MEDFLFHNLSEDKKNQIKQQAKAILQSFSEKISKVKVPDDEPAIERKNYEREEGNGKSCDNSFRKIMFDNAPSKSDQFIIAEKKKWE